MSGIGPRRAVVLVIVCGIVVAAALSRLLGDGEPSTASMETARRPHAVILVTLDTTRADHLSTYGYHRPTSPFITELANEGVRFTQAVSPMPITDPAHVSILTGLQPRTHGVRSNGVALPQPVPDIAGFLASLGYRTAAFVSRAHVVPSALGIDGFEVENGPSLHSRPATPTCERAWEWVDAVGDEPFFLWLHLFDPHHPYEAPAETERRFLPADAPPPIEPDYKSLSLSPVRSRPRYEREAVEAMIARYDAELAFTDSALRRFLERVEARLGPSQSPLVVLTADHGEAMDELEERFRFSFGHGFFLYQGLVRVPLILRWRGRLPEGRIVPGPVQLVDLAPTLFDLVDSGGFPNQGRSLVTLLDEEGRLGSSNGAAARYAFSERQQFFDHSGKRYDQGQQFAVQDGRYKLILTLPTGGIELYDLVADPEERKDRSATLPEVRARLLSALEGFLELPAAESEFSSLPEHKLEALRALGYIQ